MMDTACTGIGRLFCSLIKQKISDESCRISAEQFNVCRVSESSGVTETVVFCPESGDFPGINRLIEGICITKHFTLVSLPN